uniref:NADH:ubiquinone reductase (H(+)-translocating) n=1 Tax=Aphrocallistes vastus TaxID=83887 RepID=B2BRP5_APHVA|nr:NADH dehydrogenase subunit 2 [Aphrocallistes vastus]ABR58839.1 NADH dehydrogenase subunit 2 [Aphrocallistes vastus]
MTISLHMYILMRMLKQMILTEIILLLTIIVRTIRIKNKIISICRTTIIISRIILLNSHIHTLRIIHWKNRLQLIILLLGIILLITTQEEIIIKRILVRLIITSIIIIRIKNLTLLYITLEFQTIITLLIIRLNASNAFTKEAGLKYFTLRIFASILLIARILISYHLINHTNIRHNTRRKPQIYYSSFIIRILLFKLASRPFHTWLPDIFERTTNHFLSYLVLIPKIAIIRIIASFKNNSLLILIRGLLSITIGTIGALNQIKIKRLLAYRRINNTGIILIGLYMHTIPSIQGSFAHTIIYTTRTAIILLILHHKKLQKNLISEIIEKDKTQNKQNISISLLLLSLSGLPPLPGFLRKWLIIRRAINKNSILLPIWILITNIPATIYYLYITVNNFFNKVINYTTTSTDKLNILFYKLSRTIYPLITLTIHPHLLLIITWIIAIRTINVFTSTNNPFNKLYSSHNY